MMFSEWIVKNIACRKCNVYFVNMQMFSMIYCVNAWFLCKIMIK